MPARSQLSNIVSTLLGVLSLVVSESPAVAQQGTDSPALRMQLTDGNRSSRTVSSLVKVTPSTPPKVVAAQLAIRPVGARGLLLMGFADDIASTDLVKRAKALGGGAYPGPWLNRGVSAAAKRTRQWLERYAAGRGVAPEFALVRCSASLSHATLSARGGEAGWKAIIADRRFPGLSTQIGLPEGQQSLLSSQVAVQRWDAFHEAVVDRAIITGVVAPLKQRYPSCSVSLEGRYSAPSGRMTLPARSGSVDSLGNQYPLTLVGVSASGIQSLFDLVDGRTPLNPSTPVVPSFPSPTASNWIDSAGIQLAQPLQVELLRHLAVVGTRTVISPSDGWSEQRLQELNVALSDISNRLGSSSVSGHALVPEVDHRVLVASNGRRGETIYWRLTIAPEVQTVRVVFMDGANQVVSRPIGEVGVWISHAASRTVASFIPEQPTSGSSSTASSGSSGGSSGSTTGGGSTASSGGSGGSSGSTTGSGSTASSGSSGGSSGSTTGGGSSNSTPNESQRTFTLLSDDVGTTQAGVIPASPYLIIYQAVDPQSFQSGRMDPQAVIAAIAAEIAAGRGADWGVLDFEHPFNDIMHAGASDPRFESAMSSLVETLQAVKAAYPSMRWTYYNFPQVPYWNANRDWASLPQEERIAIQDNAMTKYAPLSRELDWFMPAIYDYYEVEQFSATMAPMITVSERSFKDATMEFLHRYMTQPLVMKRPILPAVSPWFMGGGRATMYRPIPTDELVRDQFQPAIEGGADGVAMWCATPWLMTLATRDGSNFPQWVRDEQTLARAQFVIDFFGGTLPVDYDWTGTQNVATVRDKLSAVVGNAFAALSQAVRASQLQASNMP